MDSKKKEAASQKTASFFEHLYNYLFLISEEPDECKLLTFGVPL